jgi:hypothetical protein
MGKLRATDRQPASRRRRGAARALVALIVAAMVCGCGRPNQANIQLRKENQTLRERIDDLERRHEADQATIRGLDSTTVPVLPAQRTAELFTVAGLSFGRLTGGADLDPDKGGDEAIKVYVVPIDGSGDPLKAAGSFQVEAFDLSSPTQPLVGSWDFAVDQASVNWYGQSLLYTYILTCPWQQRLPHSRDITIRVTFTDSLTRRVFTAQRQVTVDPPAADRAAPTATQP